MIDSSNILEVDGTVVAGVLILLTIKPITSLKEGRKSAIYVAIPFAVSAIFALSDQMNMPITFMGADILFLISIISTMFGFVYLVVFLIWVTKKTNLTV